MASLPFLLQRPDGSRPIPCRDAYQALLLARLWCAIEHQRPLHDISAEATDDDA